MNIEVAISTNINLKKWMELYKKKNLVRNSRLLVKVIIIPPYKKNTQFYLKGSCFLKNVKWFFKKIEWKDEKILAAKRYTK